MNLILALSGTGAIIGFLLLVFLLYGEDLPDAWRDARPIHLLTLVLGVQFVIVQFLFVAYIAWSAA